jgi:hypothetical protein
MLGDGILCVWIKSLKTQNFMVVKKFLKTNAVEIITIDYQS